MSEVVLVTGGAGFIGSHLCDRLLERGEEVVCFDNFDPYYDVGMKDANVGRNLENGRFRLVRGDVRDPSDLEVVFQSSEITKVVHLAAKAGVRPSIERPLLYEEVNVRGTLNLLEAARKNGVKNFVFGSSSSVYGVNEKTPFSEDDPLESIISPYAASKASGEAFCQTYSHLYGIPITCLRFFTVYGPRGRPDMAIFKFTKKIVEGERIEVYGDGSSMRDYTYVDDIVDGVVSALDKNFLFEIINLGDSRTVKLSRLISLIESGLGRNAEITRMPDQPGDVPVTYADIGKAGKLLGYEPKVTIEEGIKEFVAWYRENH